MARLVVFALLVQSLGLSRLIDVSAVTVGPPVAAAELDLGKLKGEFARLSWSPDGSEIYLQTTELRDHQIQQRHYLVTVAGGAVEPVKEQPAWANDYWLAKSDRSAPGIPSLMIDVQTKAENTRGLTAGSFRSGSTDVDIGDLQQASLGHEGIVELQLLGETIGRFVNAQALPGMTFGWGPRASGAIVFVNQYGALVLLDKDGRKQKVASTRAALFPAWTADGGKLAYLEKTGRKKYTLYVSAVGR